MIISHKLKCIYIKLGKVAGTSFEIALSKYCGPDDIIAPTDVKENAIRRALAFREPQNYIDPQTQKPKFTTHVSTKIIKRKISRDVWDNYLKVATIRCPYDMLISHYYFSQSKRSKQMNFDRFVATQKRAFKLILSIHEKKPTQPNGYRRMLTDFLIRYEHLDNDIKELETKIDCPGLLKTFQHITAKKGLRPQTEETAAYRMYSKYPAAKTILDERCNKAANKYEFFRKYWPIYKVSLENAIKDYTSGFE